MVPEWTSRRSTLSKFRMCPHYAQLHMTKRNRCIAGQPMTIPGTSSPGHGETHSRRQELFAFLALAILIWPLIAVGVVGGYGFIVWMSQLVLGPPGPPQ